MPDIPLKSQCFDLAFSPTTDHIYVGLLTGEVKGFSYDAEGAHHEQFSIRPTKHSCRGLAIDDDGRRLASVSKDKSLRIIDPNRGQVIVEKLGAHDSAVNRVIACGPNMIATGDDDGIIKLWDPRKPTEIRAYSRHIDYISDLLFTEEKHQLIATSGDCTLTVTDLRSPKLEPIAQSQDQDDEFLSICSIKSSTKVIVGTQMGMLSIFNRSSYLRPVDVMPGHPQSLDALVPLTDDVIATGSSDGLIRLVQILPNKLLGAVADHGDFPVERLGLSREGKWLASASHDDALKLTDVADALEESDAEDGDEDEDDFEDDASMKDEEPSAPKKPSLKRAATSSAGGDSEPEPTDDDEDMHAPQEASAPVVEQELPKGKRKLKKPKTAGEKQSIPGFFDDL